MSCYEALASSYDALTEDVGYEKRADFLEKTGASSATISRVNRSLIYGNGGDESGLEKMKEKEGK